MIKKVKLRDVTKEQFIYWVKNYCCPEIIGCCDKCVFKGCNCNPHSTDPWMNNKDIFSDIFLDQEIEIEVEVESPKLTEDEILILKYYSKIKKCKYIARDENNWIFGYKSKPRKYEIFWNDNSNVVVFSVDKELFTFIKWSDEEPYSIEELLKESEK